jgi:ABC-type branched-subunit amino acid transport system ATPase component
MIPRRALNQVQQALAHQAAVALIGPRQVGKTTLAFAIADAAPSLYMERAVGHLRVRDVTAPTRSSPISPDY